MAIHSIIKEIREDKGISQRKAAEGLLSQSNYSKYENGMIDITSTAFLGILENLDVDLEELNYIHNGYSYSEKEKIFRGFFQEPVNDLTILHLYKNKCETYLATKDDSLIQNILNICNAYIISQETGNSSHAIKVANKILDEFSKKNHLYLRDLYLINGIFFVFPIESAHLTMNYIETSVEKYHGFKEISRLLINLRLNYSLMLIKENLEKEALVVIEKALPLAKTHIIALYLGVLYIRKGICLHNLNIDSDIDFIQKGITILEVLEEDQVLELVQKEIEKYMR